MLSFLDPLQELIFELDDLIFGRRKETTEAVTLTEEAPKRNGGPSGVQFCRGLLALENKRQAEKRRQMT